MYIFCDLGRTATCSLCLGRQKRGALHLSCFPNRLTAAVSLKLEKRSSKANVASLPCECKFEKNACDCAGCGSRRKWKRQSRDFRNLNGRFK